VANIAKNKPAKNGQQGQFDFGFAGFSPDDYVESAQNEAARRALSTWSTWPGGVMALVGEAGSGKSHLGSIWAAQTGAVSLDAREVDLSSLTRLSAGGPLRALIDHANRCDETALFALLTTLEREGGAVLLLASTPPATWDYGLSDLMSRLRSVSVTTLSPPEPDLLARLIIRQSAARGYKIDETASTYLAQRLPRTFAATVAIVACMDDVVGPNLKSSQALAQRALQAYYGKSDEHDENSTPDLFDL
jgi:chromosomal replication initiation ATPase DnaA